MQETFKKIAFLAPRPGMELPAFSAYWRSVHGPTVANAPGYAAYRTRYAQNHRIGDGPVGARFPYPGVAIFHLPSGGSNEAEFSRSSTYRAHIRVDELNFIDMDRTISMAATENVIRPGNGPIKVLIVAGRRDGMERAEFDRRLRDACAVAQREACGFTDRLAGWTVDHIVEGSFQLPGARPAHAFTADCIQELWFQTEQDIAEAFASVAYRTHIAPAFGDLFADVRLLSFRAEEIVFFDEGGPTAHAAPAPSSPAPAPVGQNRT